MSKKESNHPFNHLDRDVLNYLGRSNTAYETVKKKEPVLVADNNDNVKIEVYEHSVTNFRDVIGFLTGNLNDFILYIGPDEDRDQDRDRRFIPKDYFGFNKEDIHQVKKYLDKVSKREANRYIRRSDLAESIDDFPPIERFR